MPPSNPFDPEAAAPNPFEAPHVAEIAPREIAPGVLDIGRALSDGWDATWRNLGPWIGVMVVGGIVSLVASITVIGIFVVLPVLLWGGVKFALDAVDGQAHSRVLFDGFSHYGQALGSMLGWFILNVLISIPGQVVAQYAVWSGPGKLGLIGFGYLINLAWTFCVMSRFYFAPFYIVDQGLGPIEAMGRSWRATETQKLNTALFVLVMILVIVAGILALLIGVIPASLIAYAALAAGYRQLSGTRAGEPRAA